MAESDCLALARRYLKALEHGDLAAVADLFADDVMQIEYPNRLKPNGERRSVTKLADDGRTGLKILQSQTYDIVNAVALGDRVSLEVIWTGVLAIPLGALKPGDTMSCHSGIFLDFRDGKIVGQRNYDCFAPF